MPPAIPIIDGRKKCSKCEEVKPVNEFYRNRAQREGLSWYCKTCSRKTWQAYYARNKKKIIERNKAYDNTRPGRRQAYSKTHRAANLQREKANHKAYYRNHRQRIAVRISKWQKSNPDTVRQIVRRAARLHRIRHPDRVRARALVTKALATGAMVKPEMCEACHCTKADILARLKEQGRKCRPNSIISMHHDSYKPGHELDVRGLCPWCHDLANAARQAKEASCRPS
jgi:hypothetical protein